MLPLSLSKPFALFSMYEVNDNFVAFVHFLSFYFPFVCKCVMKCCSKALK